MKNVPAHCSVCLRETKHEVLHETSLNEADRIRTYAMLQCCGCGDVCLAEQVVFTEDGEKEFNFYPPPHESPHFVRDSCWPDFAAKS